MTKRWMRGGLVAGVAGAALAAGAAHAQPVPAPPTTPNDDRDEDALLKPDNLIIVTAQKREQSLQDVPVAVTVVTGEALIGDFLTDARDLQRIAPTLTFAEGSSPSTSSINLRGIGTSVFDAAVEPTISVIVDGIVLGRNSQAFVDLIDIERIEILKGPQGTLFGKNASGGVINIITQRPSDRFDLDAELLAAEDDEYQARASVSGPLGETFGARLTGFYKTIDGNIANTFDDRVFNGSESWGVRGKLEFEPSPEINVYLIADYRETDSNGSEETALVVGQSGLAAVLAREGIEPGPENRQAFTFDPIITETSDYGVSLQVDADVGAVTLTSQTGYRRYDLFNTDDVDLLATDPTAPGAGLVVNDWARTLRRRRSLAGPANIFQSSDGDTEQFSTEFRVTSAPGTFEYVAGLFFSHVAIDSDFRRESDACLAPAGVTLAPLRAGAPCVPNGLIPGVGIPDIIPLSQLLGGHRRPADLWRGALRCRQRQCRRVRPGHASPDRAAWADRRVARAIRRDRFGRAAGGSHRRARPDAHPVLRARQGERQRAIGQGRRAVRVRRGERESVLCDLCARLQGAERRLQPARRAGPRRPRDIGRVRGRPQDHAVQQPADLQPRGLLGRLFRPPGRSLRSRYRFLPPDECRLGPHARRGGRLLLRTGREPLAQWRRGLYRGGNPRLPLRPLLHRRSRSGLRHPGDQGSDGRGVCRTRPISSST